MNVQIKRRTGNYWLQWTKKRNPASNPQIFNSKNLYIFPSKFGWIYGFVVITLFTGAINYQISTIFLMTFLLAIAGLVSAWEAHENIKDISIQLISIEDTQAEQAAQATLLIHPSSKLRFGLTLQIAKQTKYRIEKIPLEGLQFILPIETSARGYFALPSIVIASLFPFGIFNVWGYIHFNKHYYVYPKPISPNFWPPCLSIQNDTKQDRDGDDEFYEIKPVENPWIQPNLIAWKIAAKGQGWYIKKMSHNEGEYYFFSLNDLPMADIEIKLQQLSYWLQEAQKNGYIYSLNLGQETTEFSTGTQHLHHCLRLLAIYK